MISNRMSKMILHNVDVVRKNPGGTADACRKTELVITGGSELIWCMWADEFSNATPNDYEFL